MSTRPRATRTGAALAVALLALASTAAAAGGPVKGATYSGSLAAPRSAITVTFKVSANGKKVTHLRISNLPLYCSSGGPAIPIKFKKAKIKAGSFKSTGRYVLTAGPNKGKVGDKLSITGTFGSAGTESGTVKNTVVGAPQCSGHSAYSTHKR